MIFDSLPIVLMAAALVAGGLGSYLMWFRCGLQR
jgi:hypothetical protein